MLTQIGKKFKNKKKKSATADEMRDLAIKTSIDNVPSVVQQILLLVSKEAKQGGRSLKMNIRNQDEQLKICEFSLPYTMNLTANYEMVEEELKNYGFRVLVNWIGIQVHW